MMKLFRSAALRLALFAAVALPAFGALERDLGRGLAYVRVTDLPADLAVLEKTLAQPAVVVDLRYLETDEGPATQVAALLANAAGRRGSRFVLVSATTSPALIAAASGRRPGVLTLAAKSPAVTPDIAVNASPDADRAAFDALAKGTPLTKLVAAPLSKTRYDEASMTRDHANGVPVPDSPPVASDTTEPAAPPVPTAPPDGADVPAKTDGAPPATKAEPVLQDAVLKRAVQIHRALLALKKL